MTSIPDLPDEIWAAILEFLEPADIVAAQLCSRKLLKLARDNSLWRGKCYEKAPSAAAFNSDRPDAVTVLTGALGSLSLSESSPAPAAAVRDQASPWSKRARRIAQWDQAGEDEDVDWYKEFIARNAPLSTTWSETPVNEDAEIRGVAVHRGSQRAVGCREDGSVAVWDIREQSAGSRKFREVAQSSPGVLLQSPTTTASSSGSNLISGFSGVVECISLDSSRDRAYIAVGQTLNEVDLERLEVVSQQSYAWKITALSQQSAVDSALSVGTTWSLHLYDPRAPLRDRSRSPEDLVRSMPGEPEDSIAFLPNYNKTSRRSRPQLGFPSRPSSTQQQSGDRGRLDLADFAQVEPGPLSILHREEHEILVAGRFPSILSYDRRYFPRLQYVMHSGARLSSMTTIPYAPKKARGSSGANSTLVACGEYGGRGSLELYSLPYQTREARWSTTDYGLGRTSPELGATDRESAMDSPEPDPPYSCKNRQEASSAKLLSVATQGMRIVFSDAEGGLKFVERDGRGLARRWNINSFLQDDRCGGPSGELVARKIIPLDSGHAESSSNNDLLIWTGEKLGIVSTRPHFEDHEELAKAFDDKLDSGEKEEREKSEEYSRAMRRALERQADERRWMGQFRLRRSVF